MILAESFDTEFSPREAAHKISPDLFSKRGELSAFGKFSL
jgi:hypothetical protein